MKSTRTKKLEEKEKVLKKEKRKKGFKKMLIILLIIIVLGSLYMFFIEPKLLVIHENNLITDKIDNSLHGLKIVQFSDVHFGTSINEKNIKKLVKKINKTKPDIVIFNGDLANNNFTKEEVDIITSAFKKITATLGKYAVYGNHDYLYGLLSYNNIMEDSGFKILKNEYDLIYKGSSTPILIYGVDDVLEGTPDMSKLNEYQNNVYKIVVVHEPDYIDSFNVNSVDLVLSGHSHNGQINIPLLKKLVLPKGSKNYYEPHYLINNTEVYISNGCGCGLISMRLFNLPSINLFRLIKK